MHIPLAKPEILESDIAAVVAVLRSSRLSLGPILQQFERALADHAGVAHAVAVNSGTSALHLALRALRIEEGSEIIVPSFSFMAVTNAVLAARAIPVFADIDPNTLNLDSTKLEALVTSKTRAIIVVHTFGLPAPMEEIIAFADRHGLFVIEDACEAIGTELNGRRAGAWGDIGIFAFYPNKQITTGEGGALVTNSAAIADSVRSLSNQGRVYSDQWFQNVEAGYSYRLSDVNCALGLQQLSRIETIVNKREELARSYQEQFQNTDVRCFQSSGARISWCAYPVLLPGGVRQAERDEIWKALQQIGIESGRYFPPAHLQPVMRKFPSRSGDLSVTVELSQRLLCLPFFNSLQESEIKFVARSLRKVLADRALQAQAVS